MKKVMLLIVISLALFSWGCATILSGSKQNINVTTQKDKKYNVLVDDQKIAIPAVIEVKRENKDKILKVEECPSEQVLLHKEINPVFFVNILSGGVSGSLTDYMSDSMWSYQPENIKIECVP